MDCKSPLLFDLNVQSTETRHPVIRACTTKPEKVLRKRTELSVPVTNHSNNSTKNATVETQGLAPNVLASTASSVICGAQGDTRDVVFTINPSILKPGDDTASAVSLLSSHFTNSASCGEKILLVKLGTVVVGLYIGADVQTAAAANTINKFGKELPFTSHSPPIYLSLNQSSVLPLPGEVLKQGAQVIQTCDTTIREARTVGLFAVESTEDLYMVQGALKQWANGGCLHIPKGRVLANFAKLGVLTATEVDKPTPMRRHTRPLSLHAKSRSHSLVSRAECRAIQVGNGDSCMALAARCGIRGRDFLQFNPRTNLCSTLMPKQWICCSEGTLPDTRPRPQPDGTCATHTVVAGDACFAITDNYGITLNDINDLNKGTWGWAGCNRLQPGQVICLSKGNTPMPAEIAGVSCGPQKPGTRKPSGEFDGWDLAKLNPCPLNACCSGWGFCGITAEFCTESPADTSAPGSFKPGTNGCISNCGTDIVGNKTPGGSFARVGYFQAYNYKRDCLYLDATKIQEHFKDLTHVHFAFAGLTDDFNINIGDNIWKQFDIFNEMKAPFKKILSVGGWAESTEPGTYSRYREAVSPNNRYTFAQNVVKFLDSHNLDGIDFDWEYPGASDQGIPASDPRDAENYYRFLTQLRVLLGTEIGSRSLSIAIPASYWYLKPFPVRAIGVVVDYFIYMTYDLHGQWDYGNKFANPGCPNGNCLRSHINRTETYSALAMITKAGVVPWKVFRVTVANAELQKIFEYAERGQEGVQAKKWHDTETDSDIMTCFSDGTQGQGMTDWVAYMDDNTKAKRTSWIQGLNMGGTSDWALDLAGWYPAVKGNGTSGWKLEPNLVNCDLEAWPSTLEDLDANIGNVPIPCRGMAIMKILTDELKSAVDKYREVSSSDDYKQRFEWYADWVKDSIQPRLRSFTALKTGEGLKYMDCKWSTPYRKGEGPCTEVNLYYPPHADLGVRTIEYTVRDEEGFYNALLKEAGISKEWIEWTTITEPDECPTCPPKDEFCLPKPCSDNYKEYVNVPSRIPDKNKIRVEDPKDLIDKAILSIDEVLDLAYTSSIELNIGLLDADVTDVITALSMPIFMLQDASKSIEEIKKIGKEHHDTKKKQLILNVLSIVFSIIPFVGLAGQAVGIATKFAAAALIIGEIGNVALTIVDIIDNPEAAPFAILGLLIGAEGVRVKGARQAFKDAADVRRALTANSLKSFSEEFVRKDSLLQGMLKKCVR
ncbi:killer toxin alpha/beta [Nannizzia gypsea CBS 118893]|uniref:chitinase n=1 Tax=Arthroderma gypseum (strain ATCC MYA-4604 / CBS 118893) TaxID=535722 RepID=E4V536_ARTGP|nr:killer toxin alpha/beta [Nannizzia gypsea CBS 118893]EFR05110.1 killer toxin alpha/beta [Nannizzia gypsea CBS 118893]